MNPILSRRTALQAAGVSAVAGYAAAFGTTQAAHADTAPSRVVVHPPLEGVPASHAFTVRVRPPGGSWERLNVHQVRHSLIDPVTGGNSLPVSSVAMFDFAGTVEVEVKSNQGRFTDLHVRPHSFGISPAAEGRVARFTLDRPRDIVIQDGDKVFDGLHLLAGAVEEDPPADGDEGVMYFGPGLHTPPDGNLVVPGDTTVYLAPGAVLQAAVKIKGVSNSRVVGRGVLYGSSGGAISIHDCENIEIDGVTVLNPSYENVRIAECRNVTFTGLRAFTHGPWGDGIQLYCSEDVTVDGCFLRTSDDTIALYTHRWDFYGDTRDITVKNSTLWADVAHTINMGVHGNPDPEAPEVLEDLVFENIDILDHREPQVHAQGALAINAGDGNLVRNVTFDGIRVEDFRWGHLVHMQVSFNPAWNTVAGRGIESIYIKDLDYSGSNAELSLLIGLDADHVIDDVTFENLRVNGRVIADSEPKPAWYGTYDGVPMFVNDHVHDLRFLTTDEAAAS